MSNANQNAALQSHHQATRPRRVTSDSPVTHTDSEATHTDS